MIHRLALFIIATTFCAALSIPVAIAAPSSLDPYGVIKPKLDPTLDSAFDAAAQSLFQQGLGDPKDGVYRTVKVTVRSGGAPEGQSIETGAWVLPTEAGKRMQAVCWSGLVYDVVFKGPKADLDADVNKMLADPVYKDLKIIDWAPKSGKNAAPPRVSLDFHTGFFSETAVVERDGLMPLRAVLLARVGRKDLAQRVWSKCWEVDSSPNSSYYAIKDPYQQLTNDWVWALYHRAMSARRGKFDQLALDDLRLLNKLNDSIAAEGKKLGSNLNSSSCLLFLSTGAKLLKDQERRMATAKAASSGLRKTANQSITLDKPKNAERAKQLVDSLDEVEFQQMGFPGGPSCYADPIAQELKSIGKPAIAPLLDCLENDDRYTRSTGAVKSFWRSDYPIGVHCAAFACLQQILDKHTFSTESPYGNDYKLLHDKAGRKKLASHIREYASRTANLTKSDIWFQMLSNDHETPENWYKAAGHLFNPVREGGYDFGGLFLSFNKPLEGESLRNKRNPSVSEVLKRRIEQLNRPTFYSGRENSTSPVSYATELSLCLAVWEPQAAKPILTAQWKKSFDDYSLGITVGAKRETRGNVVTIDLPQAGKQQQKPKVHEYYSYVSPGLLQQVTVARQWLKDPAALRDYAALLKSIDKPSDGLLRPLWLYRDRPEMIAIGKALLEDSNSKWIPLYRRGFKVREIIDMPSLSLPLVQKQVLTMLGDKRVMGTVNALSTTRHDVEVTLKPEMLEIPGHNRMTIYDEGAAKIVGTRSIRVCDLVAYYLGRQFDPQIKLYDPEGVRNLAVRTITQKLKTLGPKFVCDDDPARL